MRSMAVAALAIAWVGCADSGNGGSDGPPRDSAAVLYISPISSAGVPLAKLPLIVGQSDSVLLKLNANVSSATYVDLVEFDAYRQLVAVDPEVIKFQTGEGKDGAQVTFTGLAATPPGGAPAKFQLRGTDSSQTITVVVTAVAVDAGVSPDCLE